MFIIEDEQHAEPQEGKYDTIESAIAEFKRRSEIPWDSSPNRCPCMGWEKCQRKYEIIEYNDSSIPWKSFLDQRF